MVLASRQSQGAINKSFSEYMLGVRQWRHRAFCVSRQHRLRRRWPRRNLMCLLIICESKFTIGESRTISHANDTQAQQVAPNPRPRRISTETPLEWERRLQTQRERRRRRQQETAKQKEHCLAQRRQRQQQETETGDWNQRQYDRSLSKTHPGRYM